MAHCGSGQKLCTTLVKVSFFLGIHTLIFQYIKAAKRSVKSNAQLIYKNKKETIGSNGTNICVRSVNYSG